MNDANRATHLARGQAAPVALFVHARPDHTRRTLNALAANRRAAETALFVFADAARNRKERVAVDAVRDIVRGLSTSAFASVTLVERDTNQGLARSITTGVGEVSERFGKVIVLEDDLVTGVQFLSFMNEALDRYAEDPRVWHINGWTYPIVLKPDGTPFFTTVMECWGWATWHDRWRHYQKAPADLLSRWQAGAIDKFNIEGGYDYWRDVRRNALGVMNTWAVFWYAVIFERGGLCLSPAKSHVVNIGIDGSGTNSGGSDIYSATTLSAEMPSAWPEEVSPDIGAFEKIRDFLIAQRPPLWRRSASWVKWSLKRARRRLARGRA